MKASIRAKLEQLHERLEELNAQLAARETAADPGQLRVLSQEYAGLKPLMETFAAYNQTLNDIAHAHSLLSDAEMRELAQEEIKDATARRDALEAELYAQLLPSDPHDAGNIFLEIRAGTGGDEAALFAGDLLRMYARYAERQRWQMEILSASPGEKGGYKEVISRVAGQGAYSKLKFESGAHRVQRVPETEAQGRVHTSACTVAILPEAAEVEEIVINPADLRVDTYRASGAGGQHVNKTDSAIRITHLPSGTVVECQDERSQHKNRARAMALLQAKLLQSARDKQTAHTAQTRKQLVGSGDRSERIRTYNFPQGRLTDHRINLTLYKLGEIMEGDLEPVIGPLLNEHQAELLAQMTGE